MDTTLEEVFLKVSEEDHSLENSDAGESGVLARTYVLVFSKLISLCINLYTHVYIVSKMLYFSIHIFLQKYKMVLSVCL